MKKSVSLLILLCCFMSTNAQNQSNPLSGKIIDRKTKEAIEMASVRVLNARDSVYVTGGATNEKGEFKILVSKGRYIVHIAFMGYKDKYMNAGTTNSSDLGTIELSESDILLNEAVVEAKAIEIQVKGDTVEYNADSYKTQPSAVVEDLLKKMPGVEVDSEGKITINGKEIKKILVDGKEFFSDDPKVASKNLPASMVNKLQVVDRKSDMTQMTGFDDGNEETVINLTVKKGMKQGVIGNGFAGYGSNERYEVNANVNVMRNNSRITALGGANNTNNAGFSDLASGMGGGGGRPRGISFGGSNGVAKTTTGGFDFATDYGNKFKWGGNIRYGGVDNDIKSTTYTKYTGKNAEGNKISAGNNLSNNFNASLRMEWMPDSLTKIIFSPSIQNNKNRRHSLADFETNYINDPANLEHAKGNEKENSESNSLRLNGTLDISRKLNDKGRVLSFSFSGGVSDGDTDGTSYSFTNYINNPVKNKEIDQQYNQKDKGHNLRAFASYVEPLGRNNFLQATYNIRKNYTNTDRETFSNDGLGNYTIFDENYTRKVKNEFLNQNISLNFRSNRQKYNYTLGAGIEPYKSQTETFVKGEGVTKIPDKNFVNFAPNGQFNYIWDKRHTLRLNYNGSTNQPTTMQLYDGVLERSAMDSTRGNPNLGAGFEHRLSLHYNKSNPEKGSMIGAFGRMSYTTNDIVNVINYTGLKSEKSYMNADGTMNGFLRVFFNTPLRNKKYSVNVATMGNYSRAITFIDNAKNNKNTSVLRETVGLRYNTEYKNPVFKGWEYNIRGNFSYTNILNSNARNDNEAYYDYGGFGSTTLYLGYDWTIDTDMSYSANSGYRSGFQKNEWLWNLSIAKQIFNNKAGTIRLKVYDILEQRKNISQQTINGGTEYTTTNAISSYFMVHFIYKLQLFKGVKREIMEENAREGMRQNYDGGHGRGRSSGGGGGRNY